MNSFKGRVWNFGDNISTDALMPNHTLYGKVPDEEKKKHCLLSVRPEFSSSVCPGDIVVAGNNFGCGSVRPASRNLIDLGVRAVVAGSFAGTFFRNSINSGLPAIECEGALNAFEDGDICAVNLLEGQLHNLSTGARLPFAPFPSEFLRLFEAGGMIPLLKAEMESDRRTNHE